MFIKDLSTILVVALAACTSMGAHAQLSHFGFSRAQTLDAEIHGRSRVRPAAGITIVGPTTVGSLLDPGVLWQDKASMLAAARTGKVFEALVSITRSNDPLLEPVLTSISVILGTEYGIPALPTRAYCAETYATDVLDMFQMRTLAEGYFLAPGGPTYNPQATFRGYFDPYVPEQLKLMANAGPCDEPGGLLKRPVLHPYKVALISLMEEYAAATREWAIAEAETLKSAKASAEQGAQEEFERRLAQQDRRRQENKAIAKSQF